MIFFYSILVFKISRKSRISCLNFEYNNQLTSFLVSNKICWFINEGKCVFILQKSVTLSHRQSKGEEREKIKREINEIKKKNVIHS